MKRLTPDKQENALFALIGILATIMILTILIARLK